MQMILYLSSFKSSQFLKFLLAFFLLTYLVSVAIQTYRVVVPEEQVILGNDVFLKCNIPSFEADFVSVSSWVDSEGKTFSVETDYGNL